MDEDIEDLYLFSLMANLNKESQLSTYVFYFLLSMIIILAFGYYILHAIVFSRWRQINVVHLHRWYPILNFSQWYRGGIDLCSLLKDLYDSAPIGSPYVGFYVGLRPFLLVIRPDVVNLMLNLNFDHFTDRLHHLNKDRTCSSLMFNTMFLAGHRRWKALRPSIEPAMSTFNVRMMWNNVLNCFPMMRYKLDVPCVRHDTDFCKRRVANSVEKHISNVIKRIAFGIDVGNAFSDDIDCVPEQLENPTESRSSNEESLVEGHFSINAKQDLLLAETSQSASFYQQGIAWLKESVRLSDVFAKWCVPEWIQRCLTSFKVDTKVEQYFYKTSRRVLRIRESTLNYKDTDFMQILLCLRNNDSIMNQENFTFTDLPGNISIPTETKFFSHIISILAGPHKLHSNKIAEYATMVLTQGYDTMSATITFCLFELAKNPEVQSKLVEELTKLSYEELSEHDVVTALPYLDMCLKGKP